jgi:hypothetical protein
MESWFISFDTEQDKLALARMQAIRDEMKAHD